MQVLWWVAALALVFGFLYSLRRARFEPLSLVLATAASLLYVGNMAGVEWVIQSIDGLAHLRYVEWVAQYHSVPNPYLDRAFRHPPGYYVLAALVYAPAHALAGQGAAVEWTRLVSFGAYLLFVFLVMQSARLLLPRGAGYYAALLLILFWPLGVMLGGRINCDIPLHACMAGVFYCLLRWQERFDHTRLAAALAWVSVGLLFKNSMAFWLPWLALLVAWWLMRRQFTPRALIRRDMALACIAVTGAALFTFVRASVMETMPVEYVTAGHGVSALRWLWVFNPLEFLTHTIHQPLFMDRKLDFWPMFVRSLLFDQFLMRSEYLTLLVAVLFFALALYIISALPWIVRNRQALLMLWVGAGLLGMLISVFSLMATSTTPWRAGHYANARYIPLIFVFISVFCGMAVEWHRQRGRALLAHAGVALGMAFAVCSVLLMLAWWVPALRWNIG